MNLKRYFFCFNPSNIIKSSESATIPAGNYMFKVINRNTRLKCEICFKLTIKTLERLNWRFIVSSKIFLHLIPVFYCSLWEGNCRLAFLQFDISLTLYRSSCSQVFHKTVVLKNAYFTEKHLNWSLFLIKLP